MFLAWWFGDAALLKPISRLAAAAKQLGMGKMDIRSGLHHSSDELGQLAKSFDDMAVLLERRDRERRFAEEALSSANTELERRVQERTVELSDANAALTAEIGERKRTELELGESKRRLRAAMDAAKLGVWRRDLLTDEIFWDARTKAIFGFASNGVITHEYLLSRILPEDREAFSRTVAAQSEQENGDINVEYRIYWPDGSTRWIHVCGSMIRDASGKPMRLTGVVMDITDRKRAEQAMRSLEEQFRQAQKMEAVGRLAGGIAHDFNNLLQVINGHSELIVEDTGSDSPMYQRARAIHEAGRRGAQLTGQLLAFSRKQIADPEIINLDRQVSGLEKMLRCIIAENIELQTRLNAAGACVKIAPVLLEQMIMNLVVNARDAMPTGGQLTIETSYEEVDDPRLQQLGDLAPGQYVMLSVSDSGHGMDAAIRERIFEPFFTTKAIGKGTGLGLSTVYGILHQSGGGIHVYSEPGGGSTFRVYLPLCNEAARQAIATPLNVVSTGTETILLAEDESAVRILIRQYLEELGYRVFDAPDGIRALELAKQHIDQIDIVITDAIMPKMGGRELSINLRHLRPEIKILMMTGHVEGVLYDEIRVAGLPLLSKPFSRREVASKLREILDGKTAPQATVA
jgi:PAS domain S-box-containing protein